MENALIQHINKFVQLDASEEELLLSALHLQTLKKKALLLKPEKVCKHTHFVVKGCLRLYFINRKQVEQITQFGLENWWITDQDSFDTGRPSGYYIQAVEDTEFIAIDKPTLEDLLTRIPKLERYFRIIMQRLHAASQNRLKFIYSQTDEERYRMFSTLFPEFMQRVPQYMVASYLGFTPQFLSKIRGKKRNYPAGIAQFKK